MSDICGAWFHCRKTTALVISVDGDAITAVSNIGLELTGKQFYLNELNVSILCEHHKFGTK